MSNQPVPAEQVLPNKLRLLVLTGKPLFPGIITPFIINTPRDLATVEDALSGDSLLGFIMAVPTDSAEGSVPELHKTGTVARILKKINLPDGGVNIIITTLRRFVLRKTLSEQPVIYGAVDYPEETSMDTLEIKALTRALLGEMKQISENNPLFSEEMRLNMVNIDHPGKMADFIAGMLNVERDDQQRILDTFDLQKRMNHVLMFIKKEQELLKIQKKIQSQINEKIEKSQREYFLKEQLRVIKQELGITTDAKSSDHQRFVEAVEKFKLQGEVKEQVEKELNKFSLMDPSSSEYHVTRNYLETIVSLPWKAPVRKPVDLEKAARILDKDHYGLEDVKERILEYMAVARKKTNFKGTILCLVGPPGVGKTSIGKSIARALNRQFFRFSVGGMRDEAEIKGHRRTYVGAMPGKIIQGLRICQEPDPVFMIDEIDKMGSSYQGDPSSALLEVLDPEQNSSFRDHYLDMPFDISGVVFVATANTLDTIPGPLLDRMEVIRLSGYIPQEKLAIAKRYIVPKSLEKHGFGPKDLDFEKKALLRIAEEYARESGVRNMEKLIDRIVRKVARKLGGASPKEAVVIDPAAVETYLGKPAFSDEDKVPVSQAGLVTGLAWTSFGGDTLTLEGLAISPKEGFKLTGQMGNVMQESASLALSYVKSVSRHFGVDDDWWDKHGVHLHIPAGATPKDGPSAGITMATCFLSLCRSKPVRKKLAMTGELSLTGQVLPIGGLKEKTIAAIRAGIKDIVIPAGNVRDLDEIPDMVKKCVRYHPVRHVKEVFAIAFDEAVVV